MIRFQLSTDENIVEQKKMWKLCFGDSDTYINFYFENLYKESKTALFFDNKEIVSMLTMIPTVIVTPENRRIPTSMLYAIATHPKYRGRGLSTQIIEQSNQYLAHSNINISMLVPAEKSLFEFYRKRGYVEQFYIREITFNLEQAKQYQDNNDQGAIIPTTPNDYNNRREQLLRGRLYVAYSDRQIAYQKKLSKQSGADIYCINIGDIYGSAAIERIDENKVIIKELLIPEPLLDQAICLILQQLSAKEYIVRLPADVGKHLGGTIRPFGMLKSCESPSKDITLSTIGYLGFAYD